jgi:methyl-accepting chemotaxis protein
VTIDNLKLRTKTLIPLAIMALLVLAMVGFGAVKLSGVAGTASEIIEHRDVAAVQLARATRQMVTIPYSIFQTLVYDDSTPEGAAAGPLFARSVSQAESLLDEDMRLIPDKASEIAKFKDRLRGLVERAQRPLKIGREVPGLANGSKLKPQELDQMAEGARLLAEGRYPDAEADRRHGGLQRCAARR